MADAFTKVQFMEPPVYGGQAPVPIGAVKAGSGVEITADGTINVTQGGGTINDIICTNGIQGGGSNPQVFIGLLPPNGATIGGVYTVDGSGISIDSNGLIRSTSSYTLLSGPGITLSNVTPSGATVTAAVAGSSSSTRGSVYVAPSTFPGLQVGIDGNLSLTPPQGTGIGGVKAGSGVTIDPLTGVLNATGSGGTITGVGAGTGLGGGGSTGAVTLFLKPPSGTTIGGVYAGPNVTIAADGQITFSQTAGVQTITKAPGSAIDLTGTATDPIIGVFLAGTTSTGVCRLYDGIDGTPPVQTASFSAATPTAVKTVADIANSKLSLSGGEMIGSIDFFAGQTFPGTVVASAFTQIGGILVGDGSSVGYAQLGIGSNGTVLTADSTQPLGVKWSTVGVGTINNVVVTEPLTVSGPTGPTVFLGMRQASLAEGGYCRLYDGVDGTPPVPYTAATPVAVKTAYDVAVAALPLAGGTMTGSITFDAGQTFPGTLPLAGGTMTGDITFAGTQTFPGVLVDGSVGATGAIEVGGTPSNPIISVDTATTSQLGVVQPDGTTITIDGNGVISSAAGSAIPSSLLTAAGSLITSTAANTPSELTLGAAGSILAVDSGAPAWRTPLQLGLLTSSAAAATYAPLDSPTFTGPVTVNAALPAGSNALIVSGGNLVLATSYTPTSSTSTGTTGELAWDSQYLYFCYAPNTWGRVAVDLTPF